MRLISDLDRVTDWVFLARKARYRSKELARLVDISLRQLERYFLEYFGRSPQDWLYELRLIKAAVLLANGARVKEVSKSLDFGAPTYFTRRFKRYHGCSPTEFIRIYETRLEERKKQFATWLPGEQVPAEWLKDPTLVKPWEILLQKPKTSASVLQPTARRLVHARELAAAPKA